MDVNWYVAEYLIRQRAADARARAAVATMLHQRNQHSRPAIGIARRLIDFGRMLTKGVRRVAAELSRALPGATHVTKRS